LVRNVDLKHEDVQHINDSKFIQIESENVDDHNYPVYSIDIEALNESGIEVDLANEVVSGKQSIVKKIVEGNYGSDDVGAEIEDVISEAESKGLSEDEVEQVINNLKSQGEYFEPKNGFIKET